MKFAAVAAIAMAAMVSAQSRNDIPSCALPCLDDAVKKSTSCSTSDFTCICKKENFSKVQGAATSCVIEKCGSDVAVGQVLPATQKLCSSADQGGNSASGSMESATMTEAHSTAAEHTDMPMHTESQAGGNVECPTAVAQPTQPAAPINNGTAPPAPTAPVTAGAAGFASLGGLAMLAVGALAL
ncbi:CFEM domain-containing protein [Metarhizium rileyi]|uniref:CFEM domain-containing protein n=1 Tax=Metarhizium rileyi (strain RCEF 4871) TaxID=1649241 RepID=A0A167KMP4_METRR|nr:CFEM domain-containing protein [Metarhizium rileyi RCEF 4871]TWU77647.1 hypothetical protein ED733_008086 [Metarhizium rileyi]